MRLIDKNAESAELSNRICKDEPIPTMTILKQKMTILKQADMTHRRKARTSDERI